MAKKEIQPAYNWNDEYNDKVKLANRATDSYNAAAKIHNDRKGSGGIFSSEEIAEARTEAEVRQKEMNTAREAVERFSLNKSEVVHTVKKVS